MGAVAYVRKAVNGSGGQSRFIPVVSREGELPWPDKYVEADNKALLANKDVVDPSKRKISLESKRRELNAGRRWAYEVDVLLDPMAASSPLFDRITIERLLASCTEPRENKVGFALWAEYNPSHRYGIGADTGKGNGNDHSTSVLIDSATIPAR
jgi:hypothetical protein